VASIEPISDLPGSQTAITIGADGSVAWDRGRGGAAQIVLWPKSSRPRDVLTTDRSHFRFEPFDGGIEVRALGAYVTSVARYPLAELATPLSIEPARFEPEASLAVGRLLSTPACRSTAPAAARLVDLPAAFSALVVDGERLSTTSFDLGVARTSEGPCLATAIATTERSRWQVSADLATGTALVSKTEYQRQPASCVLSQPENTSP
jgi:hypothetical protein